MKREAYQQLRQVEDVHWWFVARRKILSSVIGTLDLPGDARLLEIGCGTGGNLAMLSAYGEILGMEMNASAVETANARIEGSVFQGSLPDNVPEEVLRFEGEYDLVCLFDVLEHIEDDSASLARVARLVSPAGNIILTVPAFPSLWSSHDEYSHHYRRYVREDLLALAHQEGLEVVKVSYFNFWLFPLVALVRLIGGVFQADKSGQEMKKPPNWINSILQTMFASERRLLERFSLPFGVSLVAVFRKPDFD